MAITTCISLVNILHKIFGVQLVVSVVLLYPPNHIQRRYLYLWLISHLNLPSNSEGDVLVLFEE